MTTPTPLHLTIRFSTSLPDLDLDIPSPATTTVLTLKHILRNRISSRCRLRLIYQGRLLPDTAALSSVLKAPFPPPSPPALPAKNDAGASDPKGKGKAKATTPLAPRLYINCSIADELSPEALAAEAAAADKPPDGSTKAQASANASNNDGPPTSTRPRPRGFDRLLTSGFTPSEIATLRTQFASINADRYPSDAPPSPDTLRSLEDSWIDSNAGPGPQQPGEGGATADDPSGMAHGLDVLIKAMMIGFFFPLGSLTWALRQEGIWGDRWQIFVAAGVVLSVTTGIVMSISGDVS